MNQAEQERWDGRYREKNLPWDTGRPSEDLMKTIESGAVPTGKALELGCGNGTNALYLAENGFDVTAVDISPTAIEEAKRRAGERGLSAKFFVADLTADPDLGGPYDFIFDRGVYHCVRSIDLPAFLRTLERVTRPGSLYLSISGNANQSHDVGPPVVTEEEIRSELGSLFEILEIRESRFEESPMMPTRPLAWSVLMRRPA
jgi:SAM-dependent methyltransferase